MSLFKDTEPEIKETAAATATGSPLAQRLAEQPNVAEDAPTTTPTPGAEETNNVLPFESAPATPDEPEAIQLDEDDINALSDIGVDVVEGINVHILPWFAERTMFKKTNAAVISAVRLKLQQVQANADGSKQINFTEDEMKVVDKFSALHEINEAMPMKPEQKTNLSKFFKKVLVQMGWNIKLPLWAQALWVVGKIEAPKIAMVYNKVKNNS